MKKILSVILCIAFAVPSTAQSIGEIFSALLGMAAESLVYSDKMEDRVGLPQQNLAAWGIKPADYSGITSLGDGRYAVVSDKGSSDGFHVWKISQDPESGAVISLEDEGFLANGIDPDANRDCEGIAYSPYSGSIFISGESDGRILEYGMDGQRTGRELLVPEQFRQTAANQGLEALSYGGKGARLRFWTTTETALPADGTAAGPDNPGGRNMLRLQSFRNDLTPSKQVLYLMDAGRSADFGSTYVFGVPEICALPDGRLLVLEREANIPGILIGADVKCKLYSVRPRGKKPVAKKLVAEWTTSVSPNGLSWANYEGMCLGARLSDGRQTLLLVNDSQGGYSRNGFSLKDYIKVIIL